MEEEIAAAMSWVDSYLLFLLQSSWKRILIASIGISHSLWLDKYTADSKCKNQTAIAFCFWTLINLNWLVVIFAQLYTNLFEFPI